MPTSRPETEPRPQARLRRDAAVEPGLGTLCPESQADGVPCERPDADCRDCRRAG